LATRLKEVQSSVIHSLPLQFTLKQLLHFQSARKNADPLPSPSGAEGHGRAACHIAVLQGVFNV
jgi:hypothetical protein